MAAAAVGQMMRAAAKHFARAAMSSDRIFRALTSRGLHVFLYHDVTPTPGEFSSKYRLNVTPELFRQQLRWIKTHFRVISPRDLLNGNAPAGSAVVTFDDGLAGYFEHAVPVLLEERVASVIFLNMGAVEGDILWSALATYLCESEPGFRKTLALRSPQSVRADPFLYATPQLVGEFLDASGRREAIESAARRFCGHFATPQHLQRVAEHADSVFFANHLYNHFNAATLDDAALAAAYLRNERALADYANYINFFSYPYGQPGTCYDERTHGVIRKLSPARIFSALPLPNTDPAAHLLYRVSLDDSVRTLQAFRLRAAVLPQVNRWRSAPRAGVGAS